MKKLLQDWLLAPVERRWQGEVVDEDSEETYRSYLTSDDSHLFTVTHLQSLPPVSSLLSVQLLCSGKGGPRIYSFTQQMHLSAYSVPGILVNNN